MLLSMQQLVIEPEEKGNNQKSQIQTIQIKFQLIKPGVPYYH